MKKVLLFSSLILGLGVTATTASAQTVQNKSDLMKNGTNYPSTVSTNNLNHQSATVDDNEATNVLNKFSQTTGKQLDNNLVYTVTKNGNQANSYFIQASENHQDYIHLVYAYIYNTADNGYYILFDSTNSNNNKNNAGTNTDANTSANNDNTASTNVPTNTSQNATGTTQHETNGNAVQQQTDSTKLAQNNNYNSQAKANQDHKQPTYVGNTLPSLGNDNHNTLSLAGLGLASLVSMFGLAKYF